LPVPTTLASAIALVALSTVASTGSAAPVSMATVLIPSLAYDSSK
jgi:hypothetical protein